MISVRNYRKIGVLNNKSIHVHNDSFVVLDISNKKILFKGSDINKAIKLANL